MDYVISSCKALLAGVQECQCSSGLLPAWNIGSCDQPSEIVISETYNMNTLIIVVVITLETSRKCHCSSGVFAMATI